MGRGDDNAQLDPDRGRHGVLARYARDPRLLALACIGATGGVYLWPTPIAPLLPLVGLLFCLPRFPGRAVLVAALVAALWASLDVAHRLDARLPVERSGETATVVGRVSGLVSHEAFRSRFVLARDVAPYRVRLSWYDDPPALLPGDCVRATVKWETPHGSANPGTFDYEAWLWRERIDATGYVREAGDCDRAASMSLDRLRALALRRLDRILGDAPARGLIEALTLGARDAISDAHWTVLRATGTSHLVAISGLHIGLIAGVLFFLARWLALRVAPGWSAHRLAAAAAFVGAAGYAALAGLALPTQRALVMVAVALAVMALRRDVAPSRTLAFAAIAVLFWDPASVIAPGFWLSFGAVAWLLYIAASGPRRGRWLAFGHIQLALIAGLTPLTLWFFEQASMVAPVVNALLIPLAVVVVPALLTLTALALAWPAAGGPLLTGAAWLLGAGWQGLAWVADWPLAAVHLTLPGVAALLLAIAGIALLLLPRGLPGRWAGAALLLPALIGWQPADQRIPQEAYRVTVLDVGQGLAVVVRTREHTLVFDAGPAYRTGFDTGEAIVVPYLRHVGRPRVDRLLISHADLDHRGGAAAIVRELEVVRWQGAGGDSPCVAGQQWRWNGVDFRVLYPTRAERAAAADTNGRSCVLRIASPGGRVLLTGDLDAAGEARLIARNAEALAGEVLVVGHHGSDSSSSSAFLEAVRPRFALISAGWRNRWGFPTEGVRERLSAVGAQRIGTATGGALRVAVPGSAERAIRVTRWRDQHPRLWQVP